MPKSILQGSHKKRKDGFSIAEVAITTAIIGTLGSIAYPNYIASKDTAKCSDAKATMMSIPPIIGAYIDATGEKPTTWDDLSSIAVVMTSNGPATGTLSTPIKLPRTNYELTIEGPSESTYSLTANCYVTTADDSVPDPDPPQDADSALVTTNNKKDKIRSCFNVSNGASDLKVGSSTDSANTPNCG